MVGEACSKTPKRRIRQRKPWGAATHQFVGGKRREYGSYMFYNAGEMRANQTATCPCPSTQKARLVGGGGRGTRTTMLPRRECQWGRGRGTPTLNAGLTRWGGELPEGEGSKTQTQQTQKRKHTWHMYVVRGVRGMFFFGCIIGEGREKGDREGRRDEGEMTMSPEFSPQSLPKTVHPSHPCLSHCHTCMCAFPLPPLMPFLLKVPVPVF